MRMLEVLVVVVVFFVVEVVGVVEAFVRQTVIFRAARFRLTKDEFRFFE